MGICRKKSRMKNTKFNSLILFLGVFLTFVKGSKWGDVGDACVDPKAKCVIREMDDAIANHVAWDNKTAWVSIMEQFFTADMIYDTSFNPHENEMNNVSGIEDWYYSEHIPYNLAFDNITFSQLIFASEDETATTTTYANGRWKGDIGTIPGSQKLGEIVTMRIYDFYIMREDKIFYNWMLLDFVELMYYSGYRVLPESPLREGWVQAPSAMDGIPAPISRLSDPLEGQFSKSLVVDALYHDFVNGETASDLWDANMNWYGPFGIGYAPSKDDYEKFVLQPFREGMSDRDLEINVETSRVAT